jgi:hypothetical protein
MKIFKFDRKKKSVESAALKFYRENGYVIFSGVLTSDEILKVKEKIYFLAHKEICEDTAHIYGQNLQRIWNLVNKDTFFQELITFPYLLAWAEAIFDRKTNHAKFYLSSFQANILKPNAKSQILHIDTPVPDPLPIWEMKINTIWTIDDFNENNGATQIIPKSHKFGRRPNNSNEEDHKGLKSVVIPAGSLILTSGSLWHRSGANLTDYNRIALLGSFASSAFREISSEEDIIRYQLTRSKIQLSDEIWNIVGGWHGIKPGL